jgi:capsular exopolysaccharide synthesis family protein
MMNNNSFQNTSIQEEGSFDLKKEIFYYLFFWPWFLLTLVVSILAAYTYLRYTPNVYSSSSQVQITQSDASSSFLTSEVTSLFGSRVNVENDIAVITSNHILNNVVNKLNLQTSVTVLGRVKSNLLFGDEIPFTIKFKDSTAYQEWNLSVIDDFGTISNKFFSFNFDNSESLDNDYFSLIITKPSLLNNNKYTITNSSLNSATQNLKKRLSAQSPYDRGEIINLSISGTNRKRNDAILNTLIEVLTEDRITDQQQLSKASVEFINKRLKSISNIIDSISNQTILYQLNNNLYNVELQTSNLLSNIVDENKAVFNLRIQLELSTNLIKQLKSQENFKILPANIGIEDVSVNELLKSYNELIIERNNLLVSTTNNSPLVMHINEQLVKLKKANIEGIIRYIDNLKISISNYKTINDKSLDIVSDLPKQEYTMRTLAREFKFAEDLLIFLNQRKEEASISYVSVLPNLKVLSYGVSNNIAISPNIKLTYLSSLTVGLFIPLIILFILRLFDSKVNTREDLEKGLPGISILGEVPFDENYSNNNNDRSIIAESTRVIRSSMSFLLNQNKPQVIITTSTIKGEGKSFVSYNIAQSYNALGKKVILIGADLRNPQVHTLLGIERGNLGLSTFLNDVNYNDFDKLIVKGKSIDEIDYLLSGAIPPNPSELLMRLRFKELLEILKSSYDIIIIDSAPLLLVSDTTPLLPLCDLVVYVSRAQYSDKNIFPFIKEIHSRENMPPFGMVLNGLIASPSSSGYGYGYRYSYKYRYSYTYKYNYGYGYGYGRDEE